MSRFSYTLPSGAKYTVNGPAGATQLQADRIFYEQVAAGSLVGYTPGQTLTSTATRLVKFELSRLDRGTAGVDSVIIYAVNQASAPGGFTTGLATGLATQGGMDSTMETLLQAIENRPIPVSMPSLAQVQLTAPVDQADVVSIKGDDFEPESVGPLTPFQVQKLLAQIANVVDQEFDQITADKGIGRYGFTAYALEQLGYVKPGTTARYFSNGNANFVSVMSSPSVWTGAGGIYSLNDLLVSPETQNKIQVQNMQLGYQQLLSLGAIAQTPQPAVSFASGQVYTNAGLASIGALTSGSFLGAANKSLASAFLNNTVGSALTLSTISSGAVNNLLSGAGNLSKLNLDNITQGLTGRINGDIGALVANASKFGSQATALWAKAGTLSLDNISASIGGLTTGGLSKLGSFAGQGLGNIAGSLTSNFSSLSTNLTNLVPPNLSNLTGSLNVLGKAGSFATNFANPLASLNNIGGALQGQLTGALTNLQGQATAALGQAQALAGNLSNLSIPSGLFSSGGGDLVSGTQVAAGFNNTVNRQTVDAAFNRILGSSKIPSPVYEYPSVPSSASRLDIQQAQNFLQNLQGQATSAASGLFG